MPATECISRSKLEKQPDGRYKARMTSGKVMSIQRNGDIGEQSPPNDNGEWENGNLQNDKLVFYDSGYPTGSYAVLVVD